MSASRFFKRQTALRTSPGNRGRKALLLLMLCLAFRPSISHGYDLTPVEQLMQEGVKNTFFPAHPLPSSIKAKPFSTRHSETPNVHRAPLPLTPQPSMTWPHSPR